MAKNIVVCCDGMDNQVRGNLMPAKAEKAEPWPGAA
jgi:hypothetical protein